MAWQRVVALEGLNEGGVTPIRAGTLALVAVLHEGTVHVFDALCPHKFGPLAEGHLEDGCLRCPVHEAAFHLETGVPREGEGWAGTLRRYDSRVVDGHVEVDLPT